jgi:splicing factor 3B subunit 3
VGLADFTVKLYSLDPETCLQRLGTQALPALPESVCLLEMIVDEERQIFLNVGLNNGVLLKTVIDSVTGNLTDTRTRFLGSKPVKLFKITVNK